MAALRFLPEIMNRNSTSQLKDSLSQSVKILLLEIEEIIKDLVYLQIVIFWCRGASLAKIYHENAAVNTIMVSYE